MEGIDSFSADVDLKKVIVVGDVDPQLVLQKLQKWASASGKEVSYIGST